MVKKGRIIELNTGNFESRKEGTGRDTKGVGRERRNWNEILIGVVIESTILRCAIMI